MFYVDNSDTASSRLRSIKKDYRALGAAVRDSGAPVVFSSVLPVKGFERASRIWRINKWLLDGYHSQGFDYLDRGHRFEKPGLLGAGEVHLTENGKSIFGQGLAKLVKRALN